MASAGLKRPSSSDVPPHSDISSPFWPSNKRRCTTNYSPPNNLLMHQQQQQQQQQQQRLFKDPSLILGSLSDEVTSMIRNEINKQHHHSHHHNQNHHHQSPHNLPHQQHQHTNMSTPSSSHHSHYNQQSILSTSPTSSASSSSSHATPMDKPILSYRQTQHICEEVIRKREQRLREEYDKILISKLAEQYDTFVKYTQDHIESRYSEHSSHQASYLS